MKKLILFVVIAFVLSVSIPIADAGLLEWKTQPVDNVISINSLTGQVVELELIKNTDQCLGTCEAIIEIRPQKDIIADSSYYFWFEGRVNGAYNLRNHEFYIQDTKAISEEYVVSEEICYKEEKNGSKTSYSCKQVFDTRIKYKTFWKRVNFKELSFKAGETYRIKLIGYKGITDDVDWKMNFFGEKIEEWAWWNGAWTKCKQINITVPDSTLKNFVIPINITYDSDMQGDFDDIRFVNSTGAGTCADADTKLNSQLDSKVNSNSAIFWVQLKNFNTTAPKKILMYYNNAGASDGSTNNTWDNNWVSAWNFQDELKDSSQQTNELVDMEGYNVDYEVGIYGQAIQTNSSSQAKILKDNSLLGTTQQSIEVWVNKDDTTIGDIFGYWSDPDGGGANANRLRVRTEADGDVSFCTGEVANAGVGQWNCRTSPSSVNSGAWTHITVVYDNLTAQNMKIYINGTIDDSADTDTDWLWISTKNGTVGGMGVQIHMFNGTIDALHVYNKSLSADWVKRSYESSNFSKITFGAEEAPINVQTDLLLPTNNSNFSTYNIDFSANSTATGTTLNNATLYVWNSTNDIVVQNLVSVTGTLNTSNWTETFTYDDTYLWNVLTKGVASHTDWDVNRTFRIDTVYPQVDIVNPLASRIYFYSGVSTSLDLNYTRSDVGVGIDTCWYNLNEGVNNTIVGCTNTTVTVDSQPTINTIRVYVNDTVGNENRTSVVFGVINIVTSQNPNTSYETRNENLSITLGYNDSEFSILSGLLFYNGTSYVPSGDTTFSKVLQMPLISSGNLNNQSYFWNFVNGVYNGNTSSELNEIARIYVDNCTFAKMYTMNFTMRKEIDNSLINADLDSFWTFWANNSDGTLNRNYSIGMDNRQVHRFCIYPNSSSLTVDASIQYYKTGYSLRTYYLDDAELNNISQNINLYLVNSTDALEHQITLTLFNKDPIQNALIQILRYYRDTGTTKIVEILKTDASGRDLAHFLMNGEEYLMIAIDDGVVVHAGTPFKPYCPQSAVGEPCRREIRLGEEEAINIYTGDDNFADSLTYNNNTQLFFYTWIDTSGTSHTGRLQVLREGLATVTLCDVSSTSASATLVCNISGNSTGEIMAYAYNTHSPSGYVKVLSVLLEDIAGYFGDDGVFFAIILMLVMIFIGLVTRSLMLSGIFMIVGLVMIKFIGLIALPTYALVGLIFMILVVLWRLKGR